MAVAAFSFGRNWVKSLVILITQVSALGYASIFDEGCSCLRGASEVMWRDNVTIYNIKTRGNGN